MSARSALLDETSALVTAPFRGSYSVLDSKRNVEKRFLRTDSKGRTTLLAGDDVENQVNNKDGITHEIKSDNPRETTSVPTRATSSRATFWEESPSINTTHNIPEFKDTVAATADENTKKQFLEKFIGFAKEHIVQIITFGLSAGVIAPVFPASKGCSADEKCQGLFGPLDAGIKSIPLLNVGGSTNYLAANALYASLESRHAWDFFVTSTTPQKFIFLCVVMPSLCAQEAIFSIAQGSSAFWTAVASTGAAPGALFAFMQLMKIYENAPWQTFKWKYLLGSLYKPSTQEESEMLHYSNMRKKLIELLKADFDVLAKKIKTDQFPPNYPSKKYDNNWIEFLLEQKAEVIPESACSRNTRRVFRGLGVAFAGWVMTPNTVNTFKFLEENIGDESYVIPLNVILSGFLLTKNIYAMTLFLGDFFAGIYDALRNKVVGKESEWALLRMQSKLKLAVAALTISATCYLTSWSGQTIFTLMKKNPEEFKNDTVNSATLKAGCFTHFIVAMKANDLLLAKILLTKNENFLRELQKEITRVEDMNYADFKKLFKALHRKPGIREILKVQEITPYVNVAITNPRMPLRGVSVQLSPLPSPWVPQPLRNNHQLKPVSERVPWYKKMFCCGKRPPKPDDDADVVQHDVLQPK